MFTLERFTDLPAPVFHI